MVSYWDSLPHPDSATGEAGVDLSLDLSHYVDVQSVSKLASDVAGSAQFGQEDVADTVLSFVQNVGYVLNDYTHGHTLYPVETLASGGVCDDLSVLYASMMIALGFKVIFIYYQDTADLGGSSVNHVNVGVLLDSLPTHTRNGSYYYLSYDSINYYTAETTADGWRVGEQPNSLQGKTGYVEVAPLPQTGQVQTQLTTISTVTVAVIATQTDTNYVQQTPLSRIDLNQHIGELILLVACLVFLAYVAGRHSSNAESDSQQIEIAENNFTRPQQPAMAQTALKAVRCRYCGREIVRGRYCPECHLSTGYA